MMNNNGAPALRLQSILACLPDWFRNYAALHMDTLGKLINHLLIFMACCNFVLFFGAWNVSLLPLPTGINTITISLLLSSQNACCFYIYNHGRLRNAPQFLFPSEFMVGISVGITIGAAIVAWIISKFFHNLSKCNNNNTSSSSAASQNNALIISEYICQNISARRAVNSVSFWSGLVFWLEFCLTLLVIMGRHDLINIGRGGGGGAGGGGTYQDLSVDDQDDENFRRYAAAQQQQQQSAVGGGGGGNSIIGTFADAYNSSFVGNYTSVPEIRSTTSPQRNDNTNTGGGGAQSVATTHTPLGNV